MEVDEGGRHKPQHDLMMKPESSKKGTSFFKHAKKSYPMFPFHEKRMQWDEYGELINPDDYKMQDMNPTEEDKEKVSEQVEDVEDIAEAEVDVPTKCVTSVVKLDLQCSLDYIDFEGRSDGESMKKLLPQVKPRQMVIVRGKTEDTNNLAEFCRIKLAGCKVYTPRLNEVVDATIESNIYQVKLRDSLVSSLEFRKAKDTELTWVDGQLDLQSSNRTRIEEEEEMDQDGKAPGLEGETKRKVDEAVPILDAIDMSECPGHMQVFVNPPRFQDIKQVMSRNSIQAEFTGGVLVCNGTVAIRRSHNESSKLELVGTLCDDYFKIRDLLYEQYAII